MALKAEPKLRLGLAGLGDVDQDTVKNLPAVRLHHQLAPVQHPSQTAVPAYDPVLYPVSYTHLDVYKRQGGALSAAAAVIGITLPSLIVLSAVTYFYGFTRTNSYVARALIGIRAAVVPIVFFAAASLCKTGIRDRLCVVIALAAMGLCLFSPVNNALIVILGALAGLVIMGVRDHDRAH